jgi:diguanylate cyclase (GGDEF)-like protein
MQNSLQYRQAEDTSLTDYLTGLPNARSLFDQLDQRIAACGANSVLSVLVCDLDGFKQVNDRFGHLDGNRMLQLVAGVLKRNCRERDFVARMGGDEFVLLLRDVDAAHSPQCVWRIVRAIEEEAMKLCGEPLVSASFGTAHVPEDGFDPETLLAIADRRMYAVKNQKKSHRTAPEQLLAVASAIAEEQPKQSQFV